MMFIVDKYNNMVFYYLINLLFINCFIEIFIVENIYVVLFIEYNVCMILLYYRIFV